LNLSIQVEVNGLTRGAEGDGRGKKPSFEKLFLPPKEKEVEARMRKANG